ncbi:MAG: hypothetical protein AAF724_20440 [Pseudomonadota bacterium]
MAFLAAVWDIWSLIFEILGIAISLVLLRPELKQRRKQISNGNPRKTGRNRDSDRIVWLCLLLLAVSAFALIRRFW